MGSGPAIAPTTIGAKTIQKLRLRILPFVVLLFAIALIDRNNIGFAALDHIHWLGFSSWRWLLILEGAPAIVLGGLTYLLLPSRPEEVRFLTSQEKAWLRAELDSEEQQKLGSRQYSVIQVLRDGRVWHLVLVYFGMMVGLHTLSSWAPQVVKSLSTAYSNTVVGLLLILPSVTGLVAMISVSRSSDRTLERRYHVALPLLVAATALCLLGTAPSPLISMVLLCVLAASVYSYPGPFWALPNEFLTGYSAAAGIALINCVGNLGGLVGPSVVGIFAQRFGNVERALAFAAAPLLLSAVLVLILPKKLPMTAN